MTDNTLIPCRCGAGVRPGETCACGADPMRLTDDEIERVCERWKLMASMAVPVKSTAEQVQNTADALMALRAERDEALRVVQQLVARDVSTMPVIDEARRIVAREMPGCGGLMLTLQRMDAESAARRALAEQETR